MTTPCFCPQPLAVNDQTMQCTYAPEHIRQILQARLFVELEKNAQKLDKEIEDEILYGKRK